MGRGGGKLNLQLIADERSRRITFQKRKKGILKKAYEFSTLCGVDMCLIIYSPKQSDRRPVELHTYPKDRDEVNRIIEKFKLNNKPATKSYNLSDWLHEQKGKMDAKISKMRSDLYETKYPTWDERIDEFSGQQLEELVAFLDQKIESGKRILNNMRATMNLSDQKLYNPMFLEYEDHKSTTSYVGMMDMPMRLSFDQGGYNYYPQMFQCDLDLNNSMVANNPMMGYSRVFYDSSGENNQMMQLHGEHMMMFSGVPSSSMSHYAQLVPKPMSYIQYPMNISSISSQLDTSQVKNREDDKRV